MCEQCSKKLSKFFLIVVNFIFLLAGLLMLGFSIAALVAPYKFMHYFFDVTIEDAALNSMIMAIGVFGVVLGAIVVIVAFFGFAGATCNSLCLLVMYLILMILILLAQIALIVTAAVIPLDQFIAATKLNSTNPPFDNFYFTDINTDENDTIFGNPKNPWTALQLSAQCCALNDQKSYNNAKEKFLMYKGKNVTDSMYPLSCCPRNYSSGTRTFVAKNFEDCKTGKQTNPTCFSLLQDKVKKSNAVILGIAAGIVGLELLMLIFTSILIYHLRQEKNEIV